MQKRTKRILTIAAVLTLAMALIIGYTAIPSAAYYKDTSPIQGNIVTGGTLDLLVNGQDSATGLIHADKIAPGAWDNIGHATFKNNGNLPGQLSFTLKDIVNSENEITQPERDAGDTTSDVGELGAKLNLSIQENVAPDYTRYPIINGLVAKDPTLLTTQGRILQPGESITVIFYMTWPSTGNDNLAQGDSVNFTVAANLDQVH